MLSDREDDGRHALGRFHSSCPERAPSQLTVGEISPTAPPRRSRRRVEPSISVNRNVTTPEGPPPGGHSHRMSHNAPVDRPIATDFRDSRKSYSRQMLPTVVEDLRHRTLKIIEGGVFTAVSFVS